MGHVGGHEDFVDECTGVPADSEDFGRDGNGHVAAEAGLAGEAQPFGAVRAEDLVSSASVGGVKSPEVI